jgi:hypothetical protein
VIGRISAQIPSRSKREQISRKPAHPHPSENGDSMDPSWLVIPRTFLVAAGLPKMALSGPLCLAKFTAWRVGRDGHDAKTPNPHQPGRGISSSLSLIDLDRSWSAEPLPMTPGVNGPAIPGGAFRGHYPLSHHPAGPHNRRAAHRRRHPFARPYRRSIQARASSRDPCVRFTPSR